LAESYAELESVSAVARRHGLCPSQLFTWRREARKVMEEAAPVFVPAVIEPASVTAVPERSARRRARGTPADDMIELEIDGVAVKIGHGADAGVIAAVIDALKVSCWSVPQRRAGHGSDRASGLAQRWGLARALVKAEYGADRLSGVVYAFRAKIVDRVKLV
jgi:transposase